MDPKKSRVEISGEIAAQVLFESDRTCCVCRVRTKPVQLHHIDDDPSNSSAENLAVLCLECHRDTQIRGGFDRKLDALQILLFKDDWLKRVATKRDMDHGPRMPPKAQNGIETVRFLQLKENSDEHSYSFQADYPQIGPKESEDNSEMNLCISTFVNRILEHFRAEAIAQSTAKAEIKKNAPHAPAWDDLIISHKISLLTPYLLSIEFVLGSYYSMAAHPNTSTRTLNFRLKPSMQLELHDLFKSSSNYLELLSQFCISDLHKQQPARFHDPKQRSEELATGQDQWILSGAAPKVRNYDRFVLEKGGMRIFFDPYVVGSYAEGRYEVLIPTGVLAPALKESIAALLL